MTEFFMPNGSPNMNDLLVTVSVIIGGLVAYRQKSKDETILNLQEEIKYLRRQLENSRGDGK